MAGASLLALLDDITSILDDVALMTKTAAAKTTGVVGDDLAVNVDQVAGVTADRELPIVWAVAKGSMRNKCILIPAALLLSALAPKVITPLLMVGGTYLCFEGAEKVFHWLHRAVHGRQDSGAEADASPDAGSALDAGEGACAPDVPEDAAALEKRKIAGAVRTDFVLSTEIIVIALGAVPATAVFSERALVLLIIGVLMTVGVYGVVACILKLDDVGLYLARKNASGLFHKVGMGMVRVVPHVMRFLTVAGTIAMFTVGGGILAHGMTFYHYVTDALAGLPLAGVLDVLGHALFGVLTGSVALAVVTVATRVYRRVCGTVNVSS